MQTTLLAPKPVTSKPLTLHPNLPFSRSQKLLYAKRKAKPAIEVDQLGVTIGGKQILDDISFTIKTGDIVGLLGPSGAGKTTLIRSLAGLQSPDQGKASIFGMPVGSDKLKEYVGYVTQAPAVYGDLTIYQNMQYFATLARADKDDIMSLLQTLHLTALKHHMIRDLSGGQRSRVSLAVALIGRPKILFLDEPTVGLDPVLRAELWSHFKTLAANGVTILVSSHVMDEAVRCDKLIFLREGKLLAFDSDQALQRQYGTTNAEATFLKLAQQEQA